MKTPITVLFCSILLTFSYECLAQTNSWELILPGGYRHINNDSKGNIYASSLAGNLIKSIDNGVSWDTIFTSGIAHNIFIDTNYTPNDRIILDGGIDYLSTDYGETWEDMSSHLWGHRFTSFGDILAWRYSDYNIYRSTDNGISWDTLMVLPPIGNNERLSGLEVDIFNNIYIDIHYNSGSFPPTTSDEVYKSTDNGNTWSLFYESGSGYADMAKIYTTSTGDFFVKDQNRGTTVHYLLNGEIHTYSFTAISPWQNTYGHIYLITPFGIPDRVFFSSDLGNSWLEVTSGLEDLNLQHSVFCHDTLGYLLVNVPYEQNIGIYKTTFSTERIFDQLEIDFGDVKLRDTTNIQVTIQNPFGFELHIDSVVSYNSQFFISHVQSNLIPIGDSITATIAYTPLEYDTTESYVYLHTEFINARIRVIGNSPYPVIGTVPASIFLFNKVPIDSIVNKTFKIFNNSSINNLIVDTVNLKKGIVYTIENITFPIVLGTNDTTQFSISFHPIEPITYWDTLFIYSNSQPEVKIIRLLGEGFLTSIIEGEIENYFEYELNQNYPNPFNPVTTIIYQIPEKGYVTLKVYDVLGNKVATLVNEEKPAGNYEVEWNALSLPSGIYFYQLRANNFIESKKMILLK